jgi:hypothetical protein
MAMIPGIGKALLHVKYMQRDLTRALRGSNHNWESAWYLSTPNRQEFTWWVNNTPLKNGLPIRYKQPSPNITNHISTSDSVWGISLRSLQTACYWTKNKKKDNINVRELKSLLFVVQLHMLRHKSSTLKIYSDNRAALKYLKKAGGTSSILLQDLAIQIQDLRNKSNIQVICNHIHGIQNIEADHLSRQKLPLYE